MDISIYLQLIAIPGVIVAQWNLINSNRVGVYGLLLSMQTMYIQRELGIISVFL